MPNCKQNDGACSCDVPIDARCPSNVAHYGAGLWVGLVALVLLLCAVLAGALYFGDYAFRRIRDDRKAASYRRKLYCSNSALLRDSAAQKRPSGGLRCTERANAAVWPMSNDSRAAST